METTANGLVAEIERRVAAGELRPGDRLDPVRTVAELRGVAPNTVAAAYRRLRDRGVVTGRGRQGTIVCERPLVIPATPTGLPDGVVDAATGNPDPALLPDASAALVRAGAASRARYGGDMVARPLAVAGRAHFERDGVDATHLSVVSGAMDGVERLLAVRLRPGDRVGVEDPGYASVHHVVRALGLVAVPVATDERGMQPDALRSALRAGLDAIIVTPRANNPSGAAFDVDRVAALDDELARFPDVFVIEDDHAGAVAGVPYVGLDRIGRPWAVVRSAAKSLGPDLRVALVTGDQATVGRLEARMQVGPGWVSHLLQHTVADLLVDPDTSSRVEAAAHAYRHRRRRLAAALDAAGIPAWARSGLHVWVPVDDESGTVVAMRGHDIAIRAGERFRLTSQPAVRITTAALSDHEIDRVAGALIDVLSPSSTTPIA